MEDVARAAGVSRALVSIAMRDAPGVSATTRERIRRAARELGYRHNRVAADLAGGAPRAVGVFLADLRNDIYADVFDGIRAELDRHGRRIVMTAGSSDGTRDVPGLDGLLEARVGITIAMGLRLPDAELQARADLGALVSTTRTVPGVLSATSDDAAGARMATTHLLGLGHRRISFLANPPGDGYHDRRIGYETTMTSAGLTPEVRVTSYDSSVVREHAHSVLSTEDRPTALFVHNDQAAIAALGAIADLGLRCPEDVSVIGYDNSSAARMPGIELSTVDVRARDVGAVAARIALAHLDGRQDHAVSTVLEPHLVARHTTARPR